MATTVETDACAQLVALAARLGASRPSPRRFLAGLGREAAGIREGPLGLVDLARGGTDRLRGRGFRSPFDDSTTGQVRHFAGIAVAVAVLGSRSTRWISERVRHDPRKSADGRLTEAAIAFARALLDRRLAPADASEWIDRRLCEPG